MTGLPEEVLVGVSFGLLAGAGPTFLIGAVAFVSAAFDGRRLTGWVAVPVAFAGAGTTAFLFGVLDPVVGQLPRMAVLAVVAGLVGAYAESLGTRLGTKLHRGVPRSTERGRPLSADAIDAVDAAGQVTVRPAGEVRDIDGHPPLPAALRDRLEEGAWRLPADLPVGELERRLEQRVRSGYDVEAVSVDIDRRGRATIAAAPPTGRPGYDVPEGYRAVTLAALVPSGLAPGDEITVLTGEGDPVEGTALGVGSGERTDGRAATDGGTRRRERGTAGGRVWTTVAVPTPRAEQLLTAETAVVVAAPGETAAEFEAFALLERAGVKVRRGTLTADAEVAEGEEPMAVLAARGPSRTDGWTLDPDPSSLGPGCELFVAGKQATLDRLFDADGKEGDVEEEVTVA